VRFPHAGAFRFMTVASMPPIIDRSSAAKVKSASAVIRTNRDNCWRFNRQDEDDALGTLGYDSFRGEGAFNTIQ
jgi:hypothetical protein